MKEAISISNTISIQTMHWIASFEMYDINEINIQSIMCLNRICTKLSKRGDEVAPLFREFCRVHNIYKSCGVERCNEEACVHVTSMYHYLDN